MGHPPERTKRDGRAVQKAEGSRLLGTANPRRKPSLGLVRIATLAERVARVKRLDLGRVTVVHGLVQDVEPVPGSRVYMDVPYRGAPRYPVLFPRAEVLNVCRRWAVVADRMLVSEGEALEDLVAEGWSSWKLRPREWVTAWGQERPPAGPLFAR